MTTPLRRRALVALAGGAVAVSTVVATTPAATAATTSSTSAAAAWLSGQLTGGVVHNELYDFDDLGLSLDVLAALRSLDAQPAAQQQILTAVSARATEYVTYTFEGTTTIYPGSAGKLLLAAKAAGRDVRAVGGRDLVADLEATTNDATGESSDTYGLFGQTFATRGLIAGGSDEAATSVGFITGQQCEDGSFRQNLEAACPEVPEIDTTAAVLTTLAEARAAGIAVSQAVVDDAVEALVGAQAADGSFVGNGVPNANTTGLAAVALSRAGRGVEAAKAATWVARHQVSDATGGRLSGEAGAVAYDAAALAAGAEDGIDEFTRDQWIRATVQAAPALTLVTGTRAAVSVPKYARSGATVRVTVSGLAAGWNVRARFAGTSPSAAVQPSAGRATFSLRVPKGTARRSLVVSDSTGRTVASTAVQVLAPRTLRVTPARAKVKRAKVQRIVVRGLTAREPVQVRYRGKLVKRGYATTQGTYTYRFKVGRKVGKATVSVRGAYADRKGSRTFRVVK